MFPFIVPGLREHPSRNAELHHATVAQCGEDPRGRGVDQEEARVQGEAEGERQQVECHVIKVRGPAPRWRKCWMKACLASRRHLP